jgi:hypothetical protein
MKKFLILIATILISALAVSAQTVTKVEKSVASGNSKARQRTSLVVKLGPSTTYIKNGLSLDEVVRLLGQPISVSEKQDGALRLATYRFARSERRMLVAEFADGLLVSSRTESNESLSRNSVPK